MPVPTRHSECSESRRPQVSLLRARPLCTISVGAGAAGRGGCHRDRVPLSLVHLSLTDVTVTTRTGRSGPALGSPLVVV